jgi:hypothetical protein
MPIPALTANGLLPAGVHATDLPEIQARFGVRTARRVELFGKLDQFCALAQRFQLFTGLFIDGSFVTDKDEPSDVDAVLELGLADLGKLATHPDALRILDAAAVKTTYSVHLFFQPTAPCPAGIDMALFFQHLKPAEAIARGLPSDVRRGILRISP